MTGGRSRGGATSTVGFPSRPSNRDRPRNAGLELHSYAANAARISDKQRVAEQRLLHHRGPLRPHAGAGPHSVSW